MTFIVLLPLALIAFRDLRTHRIAHLHLLLLGICALLTLDSSNFLFRNHLNAAMVVGLIGLSLSFFAGLGMGDVKLLALLALLVLPPTFDSYQIFLCIAMTVAAIHILILARGKAGVPQQIPLAPAILIGTIVTLLAK